jgi:5-methylcytosine-specific restriction protein A
MSLQDIDQAEAVIAALSEFDRIGRDAFLRKYGFGPARAYFLVHDGKQYDSKAIIGAAHSYQFAVPLRSEDFSGGEQTVARKLESLGFQIAGVSDKEAVDSVAAPTGRNPNWNRDELIIALAAYVRWDGNPPGKESREIAELSQLLNGLRHALGTPANETLRNTNGVYMKLMNFRRFDPKYAAQGKSGLSRGGHLEEEIWATYHADPARLLRTSEAIRVGLATTEQTSASDTGTDELSGLEEAEEGRVLSVLHLRRERSPKLTKAKKERALRANGTLECEVCRFNFHQAYGDHGKGFIECHHVKPLESLTASATTRLDDLALLCANCHRMIHARRPWLSIEALRAIRKAK